MVSQKSLICSFHGYQSGAAQAAGPKLSLCVYSEGTGRAAFCCQQMFHLRDGAKCPWLDPASCHLPVSQGIHCSWGGPVAGPVVQDSGCKAGGAVCSSRSMHAHMGRGCQESLGHLCTPRVSWQHPGDPLARSCSGVTSHCSHISGVAVPVSCWPSGMSHSPRKPYHSGQ